MRYRNLTSVVAVAAAAHAMGAWSSSKNSNSKPADEAAKAHYADIPTGDLQPYIDATPNLKGNIEPPSSQAVDKVLDGMMSAVLTDMNADPQKLLDKYSKQVTSVLLNSK
jgi:multiple sugar transport system substrate-binding protein